MNQSDIMKISVAGIGCASLSNAILPAQHDAFKAGADVIAANRTTEELSDVDQDIFGRDLFGVG